MNAYGILSALPTAFVKACKASSFLLCIFTNMSSEIHNIVVVKAENKLNYQKTLDYIENNRII